MTFGGKKLKAAAMCRQYLDDESGATAIEYGLIVALIFLGIIAGVRSFSNENTNMYMEVQSTLAAR
jgi:pilus assembly protein Flp/PilA